MNVSRIYRLLRMITMLQSGRNYTAGELSRELEVSRRTVFRDLNVLEMARVPYYYDHQHDSYRINQHFFLSPLNLTLPEALALLVSARRTLHSSVLPLASSASKAAMKLESVLPQPVRQHLGEVLDKITIRPTPSARHDGLEGMFERLSEAVAQGRLCRIVYLSFLERKQMSLLVEPLRLVFVGRAWYLVAYSRGHRQQRTFKLGRIKSLKVTTEHFTVSDKSAEVDFGQAWCMIPEGRLYDVHLRFSPKTAGNVAEVNWHPSQKVQFRPDGSLDFHARVDGLGEIAWWVLGYGDCVKVLQPPELAQRVRRTALSVAKQYAPEGKS